MCRSARRRSARPFPAASIEVDVRENQIVKKGQVLFKLDPIDLQAAADRAEAQLAAARLQVVSLRNAYDQQKLVLASDLTTQAFARKEADRQRALLPAGVASEQQATEAAHMADMADAAVAVARQQVATALANLGVRPLGSRRLSDGAAGQGGAHGGARPTLIHTVIFAPMDGIVTRVDQLQVGAYINASQTAFWLLSGDPWVAANFKEDQLGKMRDRSARDDRDRRTGRTQVLRARRKLQSRAPATAFRRSRPRTPPATGSRSSSDCRCGSPSTRLPPDVAARAGLSTKVTVDVQSASRS